MGSREALRIELAASCISGLSSTSPGFLEPNVDFASACVTLLDSKEAVSLERDSFEMITRSTALMLDVKCQNYGKLPCTLSIRNPKNPIAADFVSMSTLYTHYHIVGITDLFRTSQTARNHTTSCTNPYPRSNPYIIQHPHPPHPQHPSSSEVFDVLSLSLTSRVSVAGS